MNIKLIDIYNVYIYIDYVMLGNKCKYSIIVGFYIRKISLKLILFWGFCLIVLSFNFIICEIEMIGIIYNSILNIKLDNRRRK